MDWWIWVLGGLVLLAVEVATPGGVLLLFFGAAALIVGALVGMGLGGPVWVQWILFSTLSIVSLLTLRGPILRRMKSRSTESDSVDSLLGETVIVTEDVAPGTEGRGELRGSTWTVENIGDKPLTLGQHGVVQRVDGLKLFIRRS